MFEAILCHQDDNNVSKFLVIKGGNGKEGRDGADALLSDIPERRDIVKVGCNQPYGNGITWSQCIDKMRTACSHVGKEACKLLNLKYLVEISRDDHYKFVKDGEPGESGGLAGRGGCGGVPGFDGSFLLSYRERDQSHTKRNHNNVTFVSRLFIFAIIIDSNTVKVKVVTWRPLPLPSPHCSVP